jgi:hypothetical protein
MLSYGAENVRAVQSEATMNALMTAAEGRSVTALEAVEMWTRAACPWACEQREAEPSLRYAHEPGTTLARPLIS